MYKAIYLERVKNFITGNDVDMTFFLRNSNSDKVTDLTGFKIKCGIINNGTEIKLANTAGGGGDTQISVSGSKFIVHMSNTNTDIIEGKYDIEIEVEKASKITTVYRDVIEFTEEIVTW